MTTLQDAPLFTVAFVEAPAEQIRQIQTFRAQHDPQYAVIAPHFTLLFAVRSLALSRYLAHVAIIAAGSPPIDVECCHAEIGAGVSDNGTEPLTHVYLVPQQGGTALSSLHDHLYGGPLQPFRRRDLPYIPHITLASTLDPAEAQSLCDDLNRKGVLVRGRITELTVGTLRNGAFEPLASYPLAG